MRNGSFRLLNAEAEASATLYGGSNGTEKQGDGSCASNPINLLEAKEQSPCFPKSGLGMVVNNPFPLSPPNLIVIGGGE